MVGLSSLIQTTETGPKVQDVRGRYNILKSLGDAGQDSLPSAFAYALVNQDASCSMSSFEFLDALDNLNKGGSHAFIHPKSLCGRVKREDVEKLLSVMAERKSRLQSTERRKHGMKNVPFYYVTCYIFMPFLVLLSPFFRQLRQPFDNILQLLCIPSYWRGAFRRPTSFLWWISLSITSSLVLGLIFNTFAGYTVLFGDAGAAEKCATVFEVAGPLLLYFCICVMAAMYAAKADTAIVTPNNYIWDQLQNLNLPPYNSSIKDSPSSFFSGLVLEMSSVARFQDRKWLQYQQLCCLFVPIPYVAVPFISRYRFGCRLLGDGITFYHEVFGSLANYMLCSLVIFWITDLFYVLWEKSKLMELCFRHLERFPNIEWNYKMNDKNAIDELLKAYLVNWTQVRLACSGYRLRDFRQREGILQGVCIIFFLYVGFTLYAQYGNWSNNINGQTIFLVSFYTVLITGSFLVYPIIVLGMKINDLHDESVSKLRQLAWIGSVGRYDGFSNMARQVGDLIYNEEYHFKIFMVPITKPLLRSVVTMTVGTLASSIRSFISV
ncbi:hypothetical protein BKA69DRAFT_1083537 [Paraphysoderma sedebokerense]|nr:hypothetical protein BKA69DRAFT_1083537 [Paraphysoderma sedebokerense]